VNAIDNRYKQALIDEYESYSRAKRTEDAAHVAEVLREQYGYDVEKHAEPAPRTTAEPRPPEAAVAAKPEPASMEEKPTAAKKAVAKRAASQSAEGK
jgi:hypothetical protein